MNANHEDTTDVRGRLTGYLAGRRRRHRSRQLAIQIDGSSATGSTFALSTPVADDGVSVVWLPLDSWRSRSRARTPHLFAEPTPRPAPTDPAARTGDGAPRVIVDDGHALGSTSSAVLRAMRDLQDAAPTCRTPILDATDLPVTIHGHGALWTPETTRDQEDAGSRGSR